MKPLGSYYERLVFCVVALLTAVAPSEAGFLDDIADTVGDAVETGWRTTTAPVEAIINTGKVIGGTAEPESIIQPYVAIGQSATNSFDGANALVNAPQQEIYRRVQEFAGDTGGDTGDFVFDIATFNQRFFQEMNVSGNAALANVLRGQNPLQMTSVPLAAAIRAARERHASNARPLPNDVKSALAQHFPQAVLDRAMFAVGNVEITLPNFIGQGAEYMGDEYAVVVDDIIVFNETPPPYVQARFWWAHEVTHVEQYGRWGVESFAFRYVRDLGQSIEGEADNRAANASNSTEFVGQSSLASTSKQLGLQTQQLPSVQIGNYYQPVPEYFVSQCFFPQDPAPVHYMVTNTGKLVAVELMTGRWVQVGWATPPRLPGVSWSYQTPHFSYAVFPDGAICTPNQFGQFVQIGHVVRI